MRWWPADEPLVTPGGHPCPVCGEATREAGARRGNLSERVYALRHCPSCRFSFVVDPPTDLDAIYAEAYYRGEGADPLVDYEWELAHASETIRRYEWRGIASIVASLTPVGPGTRWLDFGSGVGGLVDHCRRVHGVDAIGYEDGWGGRRARERGIPVVDEAGLGALDGTCDVVTAVEVLEHIPDPVAALARIRRLLRPGGLLFLTTGNAEPQRSRLAEWPYVIPEIHVSFFEPATMETALRRAGLRPERVGYRPGFTDVIRFKVLKNLHRRRCSPLERLVPWPLVSRVLDHRIGVSAHPVGWAE